MTTSTASFDKIAASVTEQLVQRLGGKDRWTYYELTRPGSDEHLRRVFMQGYEEMFVREKKRLVGAPVDFPIPYTSDAVLKQVQALVDELKRQIVITRKEVESILRETVLRQIRYIVMPLSTIESLLFEESSARTVGDIVAKFREFEKYRYYPDALEKYAQAKYIVHLTKGQMRLLVTEINQSLFGVDGLDNVLKVSGLIMKEVGDLQGTPGSTIDITLMMLAFADRALRDFEVALNVERELGNDQINLYGLRQVLNRFALLKDKKGVVAPRIPEPVVETVEKPAEPPKKEKDTTGVIIEEVLKEDESGEVIDIHEIIGKVKKDPTTKELKPPTSEINVPSDKTSPTVTADLTAVPQDVTGEFIKEELVEGFSDDTAAIKLLDLKEADRLAPMENLITEKDEKIFLRKIFSDDRADYRGFVNHLNRTKNWKEAINVLDEKLYANKVDPYCKEAIRFSDIVYARFYPPEKNETAG